MLRDTGSGTPALDSAIIGGFLPFPATNVHDALHARCLVLDDGKTRLALVVVDLPGIHYNVSHEARKFIEQETGTPATNVLISATHTHSAASALGEKHFEFPQEIDDYQAFVARRIADGFKCAATRLCPAQFGIITVEAPEHVQVDHPYSYARRILGMVDREDKVSVPLQVLQIGPASRSARLDWSFVAARCSPLFSSNGPMAASATFPPPSTLPGAAMRLGSAPALSSRTPGKIARHAAGNGGRGP